jgi:hypothetical protein
VYGSILGWECYCVWVDVGKGVLRCMGRCWDRSVTVYGSMLGWECYCVWVVVVTVHGSMLVWECYCVWVDVRMGVLLCMGRCWEGSVTVYGSMLG